jgi:hypothetical protein
MCGEVSWWTLLCVLPSGGCTYRDNLNMAFLLKKYDIHLYFRLLSVHVWNCFSVFNKWHFFSTWSTSNVYSILIFVSSMYWTYLECCLLALCPASVLWIVIWIFLLFCVFQWAIMQLMRDISAVMFYTDNEVTRTINFQRYCVFGLLSIFLWYLCSQPDLHHHSRW